MTREHIIDLSVRAVIDRNWPITRRRSFRNRYWRTLLECMEADPIHFEWMKKEVFAEMQAHA